MVVRLFAGALEEKNQTAIVAHLLRFFCVGIYRNLLVYPGFFLFFVVVAVRLYLGSITPTVYTNSPPHLFTLRFVALTTTAMFRIITVHGRTKEQKGRAVASCDWDAIRRIKEALPVPVFSNGGISSLEDCQR